MADVDIIALWNKGKESAGVRSALDIDEIISKKSRTPLYWIKIILWIEFWLNVASLPLMYLYFDEVDHVLYGIVMPVIIIIYLFYYQFLILKIRSFDYTDDVKSGLKKLYGYLNFFFLHYKVAIWTSLIFGYVYGVYTATLVQDPEEIDNVIKYWGMLIGVGVGFIVIVGLFFNFLINLIYGRKIKRLKTIVKEFN